VTRAQAIVYALLENDSLDSFEGNEGWDWDQVFKPGTEQHRRYNLRFNPPKSEGEARKLGVNWYIKDHRKYTFNPEGSGIIPNPPYPRNSHTMATNRNLRRKSFGYRDVYSTRDRDWPSGGRDRFYRRADKARERREREAEEKRRQETERSIGGEI